MKKIKICGLTRPEDIEAVNEAKPDYIGFLFAENKRRTVNRQQAAELKRLLSDDITAVGVFLNQSVDFIVSLVQEGIIDMIQLHGDEDAAYILSLREKTNAPVMKAVRARNSETILLADSLPVDYILIDAYQKGSYGGTGMTFDYSIIPQLSKPYFIAGGLNPDNLSASLAIPAFGLDLSSGAETDGVKDKKKIIQIVKTVRGESICQREDSEYTAVSISPKH